MSRSDVSQVARALQTTIHQKLTPAERLLGAMEMSDFARKLAEAGVRARHPASTDAEIHRILIETLYGSRSSQR